MITGPNIIRDGLVFGYDADDRSTRFYKGEPTVNLHATLSAINTNATLVGSSPITTDFSGRWGWCNYGGSRVFNHISTINPYGYVTIVGNLINTADGGDYRMYIPDIGSNTLNKTFTFSVWIKNNGGTVTSFYATVATNGDSNMANGPLITLTNEWQRYSFTHTFTGTCTNSFNVYFFTLGAGTNVFLYGAQLEEKSHATQFVNGERTNTNSLIDLKKTTTINLSNVSYDSTAHPVFDGTDDRILIPNGIAPNFDNGGFTLEFITYRTAAGFQGGTYLGKGNGTTTGWSFRDGSFFIFGPTSGLIASIPFNAAYNTWQHHVITYNPASSPYIKHYLNSTLYNYSINDNSSAMGSTNSADDFYIGYNNAGGVDRYYIGKMPIAKLYSKALTPSEIQQNFNSYKSKFSI